MQEEEVLVVMVSCPDGETATRLATTLVNEGLAACVSQLPEVTSTYVWEGRLQTEAERLLLAKTTRSRLATLTRRVHDLHPGNLRWPHTHSRCVSNPLLRGIGPQAISGILTRSVTTQQRIGGATH